MVTYSEIQDLLTYQQDFNARVIVLIFYALIIFGLYIYQNRLNEEWEWQRLRNFLLKYILVASVIFYPMLFIIMLLPDATLLELFNLILTFYKVAVTIGGVLAIVFYYDIILYILSKISEKLNFRRHHIFPKRGRKW